MLLVLRYIVNCDICWWSCERILITFDGLHALLCIVIKNQQYLK